MVQPPAAALPPAGPRPEPAEGQATVYVGIDIHRSQHVAAVVPLFLMEKRGAAWKRAGRLEFTNRRADFDALLAAIGAHEREPERVHVAIDHTGGHYSAPLVHFLTTHGFSVWHLEPKAVRLIRKGVFDEERKSDELDAATMARLLYMRDRLGESMRIAPVRADLTARTAGLRATVLQRDAANKAAVQATNRLHQYLTATFPEGEREHFAVLADLAAFFAPTPRQVLEMERSGNPDALPLPAGKWDALVALASDSVGVPGLPYERVIRRAGEDRARAVRQRDLLTAEIEAEVRQHPYGPILLSFPYLGPAAAATIIAIVEDVSRYPTRKHFRKALGLYSTEEKSGDGTSKGKTKGKSKGKSKMGREGTKSGRRTLYQVAMGCVTEKARANDLRDYYRRLVERKGRKKKRALVATAGKLAEVIYHCLQVGEPYAYQRRYAVQPVEREGGEAA